MKCFVSAWHRLMADSVVCSVWWCFLDRSDLSLMPVICPTGYLWKEVLFDVKAKSKKSPEFQ